MKKICVSICLIAVCIISFMACSQETEDVTYSGKSVSLQKSNTPYVYLVNLPGKEIAFLQGYDGKTEEFNNYYVFQYDSISPMIDVSTVKDSDIREFNDTNLKVLIENELTVFTIENNYVAQPGEKVYYGYGLSERHLDATQGFKLLPTDLPIQSISDVIEVYGTNNKFDSCDSGGKGALSCSTSGTVGVGGNTTGSGCSVSCADGYWSCCNKSANTCNCLSRADEAGGITGGAVSAIKALKKAS